MALKFRTEYKNNYACIYLEGELNLLSTKKIREEMSIVLSKKCPIIFIELGQIIFVDSSGLGALLEAQQLCKVQETRFILVNMSENVQSLFELTRLIDVFEIYSDIDAALA